MLVVRVDDPVKDGAVSAVTRVFDALWRLSLIHISMFVAWDACFNKGRIAHPLKEIIRVQLSRAANCTY